MQAFGITAAVHETAGELVDNNDFAVFYHIIPVPDHQGFGFDSTHDMMGEVYPVLRIVQVFHAQGLFRLGNTCFRRSNLLLLFIYRVIFAFFHVGNDMGDDLIQVSGFFTGAGNDQRGTGFINQNGVHFVHDTVIQFPLYHLVFIYHHVVTQVVETELVVSAVSNICLIGRLPLREVQIVYDKTYRQTEELIDSPHVHTVTTGQVIIDGNYVYPVAR